jgi:site-specific recombinase XerD
VKDLRYLQPFLDRHGKWRIYFRRRGSKLRSLPVPPGYQGPGKPLPDDCLAFLAAYQAAMADATRRPGESRTAHGTVGWLVAEYFASLDFLGRAPSARTEQRRVLEDFRARRGDRPAAGLETHHFEQRLAQMIDTPAKANTWLAAMRDLMAYAVKRKLIGSNPVLGIKRRRPKNADGHYTWSTEEVDVFRAAHPAGAKARLALELMLGLALRRSDAIRVGPPHLKDGVLKYTQHKGRVAHPMSIETPMPAGLVELIRLTPGTGLKTWLVNAWGRPFKEENFTVWFRRQVQAAGLDPRCTPHGLRKRALTDLADRDATPHQIMAVSGHRTLKEVTRYTEKTDRAHNAREAMRKRNETATTKT